MNDYINRALEALEDGKMRNANTLALIAIASEVNALRTVNQNYYRYTRRRDEVNFTAGQLIREEVRELFDDVD